MQRIMLEELFDTSSDNVEKHEATFHKGDDDRLHVHVGVRHIQQLKQMFYLINFPDSRRTLESKLKGIDSDIELQLEMKNSLKIFQDCVLKLNNTLTDEQKEALEKIKDRKRVRIEGPAGCGKTFLAVYLMLERLLVDDGKGTNDWESSGGLMLVCLDTMPLGNDIAKWLCHRLGSLSVREMNKKLKRIHFMYRSGDKTELYEARIVEIDGEMELQQFSIDVNGKIYYFLIVVDEGHHVFRKEIGKTHGVLARHRDSK